jgi:hypothetical protein
MKRTLITLLAMSLTACIPIPVGGGGTTTTEGSSSSSGAAQDDVRAVLEADARLQFQNAGIVRVDPDAWSRLSAQFQLAAQRLENDSATAAQVSRAREESRVFVGWMIEAAGPERVISQATFSAAMRRCRPPRYPVCP